MTNVMESGDAVENVGMTGFGSGSVMVEDISLEGLLVTARG